MPVLRYWFVWASERGMRRAREPGVSGKESAFLATSPSPLSTLSSRCPPLPSLICVGLERARWVVVIVELLLCVYKFKAYRFYTDAGNIPETYVKLKCCQLYFNSTYSSPCLHICLDYASFHSKAM